MTSSLGELVTGRSRSFFHEDIKENEATIRRMVEGRRILAVGAAGSIGTETVKSLLRFNPKALYVVDQNENALAELVRQLRSRAEGLTTEDFRTFPIDFGGGAMRALLLTEPPFDAVLNFAAIKHVRSEKDVFSLSQMFETNIVKQARFLGWLSETGFAGRYFSVSTDKAADPSSFMGASKRMMEHVLFSAKLGDGIKGAVTSARFANVAFSNGSLLQSFEIRLQRGEILACPKDIRRYFVSLEESGDICTLATLLLPGKHIGIPRLDPEKHLVLLEEIVDKFLRFNNLEPRHYTDEEEARAALPKDRAQGAWPVVITKPDTAGEKPYEQFIADGETAIEAGLKGLMCIPYKLPDKPVEVLLDRLDAIAHEWATSGRLSAPDKDTFKRLLADVEPGFAATHRESSANLDQRV